MAQVGIRRLIAWSGPASAWMNIKPENRFWIAIYGFTAFIMLVAMGVFAWLTWTSREEPGVGRVAGAQPQSGASSSIPEERYELLAAFEAPAYEARRADPQPFVDAMALYAKRDYAAAAPALRAVTNVQPAFAPARFYLGVSLLLAGNHISGIQELRALAEGDGPYLERSKFYLAKGLIAEHDIQHAQQQLQSVIDQHGPLEKQAASLLNQIHPS
jgi:hypothetical protein